MCAARSADPPPLRLTARVRLSLPELLLLADLHLDPHCWTSRHQAFCRLLAALPAQLPLAILGDLFDYWLGDDWDPPALGPIFSLLAEQAQRRLILFQTGNRDFLAGRRLAARTGWRQLPPLVAVTVGGTAYLLTHGDALCWDDRSYLLWRAHTRRPAWRKEFLAQPLSQRLAAALTLRALSRRSPPPVSSSPGTIPGAEVSSTALTDLFLRHPHCSALIHGHTHRPLHQILPTPIGERHRWVLPEWNCAVPPLLLLTPAGVTHFTP
ncbi:MAG: UDP-2,3-diacylglucosamine diphosphatase [Hydrogenophilus sp.]|nr:UDP-2,3-diacylglucosamine diphosphatase [Hydrogenophilus sp.]